MLTMDQQSTASFRVNSGSQRFGQYRQELYVEYYSIHDQDNNKDTFKGLDMEYKPLRATGSIKRPSAEDKIPTVLALQLAIAEGPDRLPADKDTQEALCGKLRMLETDLSNISSLISELSAHLVSINSEERTIFITFKSFDEIWKFTTYHSLGFLRQSLGNLLLDQEFWLNALDQEEAGIEVSIKEEVLHQMYRGVLMQEGSFFGSCTVNQMFDSSTSGSDLYLEKGDIAQFEPPFLGSGWTVQSLADGSRGTKSRPALEPVIPFHEWFLKSCPEWVLVGSGKTCCDLPFQIAVGICEATEVYDGNGPDELSFEAGDRIIIKGLLVTCFEWFMGKLERTGDMGLCKSN